jgi:hypothetical protein
VRRSAVGSSVGSVVAGRGADPRTLELWSVPPSAPRSRWTWPLGTLPWSVSSEGPSAAGSVSRLIQRADEQGGLVLAIIGIIRRVQGQGPRSHHLGRPRLPSPRNRPRKSRPSCPPGDRPEQLHRSGDPPGQPGQPGQPERSDPSDRRAHPRMIKQGDRGSRGLDDERGLDLDLAAVDRGTRGRRVVPVVASAPRALAAAGSNSAMCCAFTDGCDHDATSGPANEILAPGREP